LLSGHYRGPINFSRDLMEQSRSALERMKNAKANLIHLIDTGSGDKTEEESSKLEAYDRYRQKFIAAMDDDLNTADAISAIFELIRDINTDVQSGASRAFAQGALALLDELAGVLGLLRKEKEDRVDEAIEKLIAERQEARARKDFARSDAIRDELAAQGITLKDTPQGVQIIRN
jgi:cysteinyl-tRNA synthetase